MTFTNPSGAYPPTICGYNTGHHLYIDNFSSSTTSNPTMTFSFSGKLLTPTPLIKLIVRPQGQVSLDTGRFEWIRSPVELFTPLRWAVSSITWIIMGTLSHSTSAWMTITTLWGTRNIPSVSGGTVRCVGSPTMRRMTESHSTCRRHRLSPR